MELPLRQSSKELPPFLPWKYGCQGSVDEGFTKYKRIQSYHKDSSHYQESCSANLSSMKHRRPLFGTRRRGAAATAAAFKKETPTQINRLSSTNVQNKKNKQGYGVIILPTQTSCINFSIF